jgi:hypothetical protein
MEKIGMALAWISSMLKFMTPSKSRMFVLGAVLLAGTAPMVLAEAKPNPYQAIVERNPFGLKPPPPPVDNTPPPPVIPLAKVVLTGISSVFGPTRALLEVTEQEPGKTATTRRPILREGERDGTIEVVSIDVEKNLVKIRNSGNETNISFETPKLASSGPAAPAVPALGGFPPPPFNPAVPNPNPLTGAIPGANPPGRGGVTIVGGGVVPPVATPSTVPGGSSVPPAPPNPGAFTLPTGAMPAYNNPGGLRQIPSRSLRTDSNK